MKKYEVIPQVYVFKDLFTDEELSRLMQAIENTKNVVDNDNKITPIESMLYNVHGDATNVLDPESPIDPWVTWYTFGEKSSFANKPTPQNINNEDNQFLYDFKYKLFSKIEECFEEYKKDWIGSGSWPTYVDDWSLGGRLNYGKIEILQHYYTPEQKFSITFHTDSHEHREQEPGDKHVATVTFYVNDDYEGGEIEFLNENDKSLVTYKPKRGDLTIFPSGLPFWHSAKSVISGKRKLFLRLFILWSHDGSNEWKQGLENYGEEKWKEMSREKIQEQISNGEMDRQVLYAHETPQDLSYGISIIIEEDKRTYVDGRQM
jgi:hypothetical protein